MIKIILIGISGILVLLSVYMYSDKVETPISNETKKVLHKELASEEVIEVIEIKVETEVKTPYIEKVTADKVIIKTTENNTKEANTEENIDFSDKMDTEQENLRDDMVYFENNYQHEKTNITSEELLEIIKNDMKNSLN